MEDEIKFERGVMKLDMNNEAHQALAQISTPSIKDIPVAKIGLSDIVIISMDDNEQRFLVTAVGDNYFNGTNIDITKTPSQISVRSFPQYQPKPEVE